MKKKMFGVFVSLLVVVMLTTPLVGTVMAGKGQTKVDFRFVLVGTYDEPAIIKLVGQSEHYLDMPFVATGWWGSEDYPDTYPPLVLEIDGEAIDPALLSYTGMMKAISSNKNDNGVIMVDEIITIGDGEGGVAGTIVLQVKGNNYATGNGGGDSFIGFGTGAFEGVKIQGRTPDPPLQVGEIEVPDVGTFPISLLERVGTVMGWPTP
jgi:hypothetical protein